MVDDLIHNATNSAAATPRVCDTTFEHCGKQQIEDGLYWLGIMALVSWISVIICLTKDYWFGDARCVYCNQVCHNKCNARLIHQMAHRRPESHWLLEWQTRRNITLNALGVQRAVEDAEEMEDSVDSEV